MIELNQTALGMMSVVYVLRLCLDLVVTQHNIVNLSWGDLRVALRGTAASWKSFDGFVWIRLLKWLLLYLFHLLWGQLVNLQLLLSLIRLLYLLILRILNIELLPHFRFFSSEKHVLQKIIKFRLRHQVLIVLLVQLNLLLLNVQLGLLLLQC